MIKIKETIIVEGRYDKNTLSQIVDTIILETNGFGIFNDKENQKLIRQLCEKNGVIILTDSDGAGLVIRNYLKGILPSNRIKNAYIPEIIGKERRKTKPSKEGTVGVEAMSPQILIDCLRKAGATIINESDQTKGDTITKTDLYRYGLFGKAESSQKRKKLQDRLGLPSKMSANALTEYLNHLYSKKEIEVLLDDLV